MLGFVFGILSAASFGMTNVMTRRGVLSGTVTQGLYMSVLLGVPLFLAASAVSGQLFHASLITVNGYLLLIAAGILHFVGGRYCNFRAISAIGATRLAPIGTIQLPYSVIAALIFLGERVTPLMGLGILLIMIGPAIIFERNKKPKVIAGGSSDKGVGGPAEETPTSRVDVSHPSIPSQAKMAPSIPFRQAEGYFFGILGATAYGTSPIFIRAALVDNGLGVFGGLVSYSAAAVILVLMLGMPGRIAELQGINMRTFRWFSGTAVSVFFAQMFRFMALGIAPVAVVATLQRMHVLFVLFFSFLINRELENFSPKVIIAIVLSVAGAVLLALGRAG